ncbi:hypothetical protein G8759_31910 [Spirosoma aureum]|uniref:Macroglobulin domain-containing protein n=1 Tax=Spirosoma aureum TaxID=2692134 RepID=A0A6G9AWS4_9BACT|nr:hypothetical protein [Spirosoma aureum]QIP16917.1 hypothetical protein G8759_31910 [Spirosoma aureum]
MYLTHKRELLFILLFLSGLRATAQAPASISPIMQSFDAYRRQTLQEKLFLHVDQPMHFTGETVWFKLFYVDGSFHRPLTISKVAYVELLDKDQKSVLQAKITLSAGGGNGSLFLPASVSSGNYVLRAYTSWMRNFSTTYFFEQPLTIINPFKPLEPPVAKETPNYSVQLFPEGGNLVQGLRGKVAFSVTDAAGHGISAKGFLLTAQNDTISRFSTFKFGIGSFSFTPSGANSYRVVISDEKGRTVTQTLPASYEHGYTMHLDEADNDQLKLTVTTNATTASAVYLLAHTRQLIKAAEMKPIQREATFLLDKKALGEGISHLTIFDADRKPVCERLYFKRPIHPLAITLKTDQNRYAYRTKVTLDATVQASATNAAQADLSVAVYRVDSLASFKSKDILSYLWLSSDLAGAIESPEYYFQSENADSRQATDNLMLTHGWRRFKWESILTNSNQQPGFQFIPDYNGLLVQGRITDPSSNAPAPKILTYLSAPGKPVRLFVSRSDSAGRIRFEMQDFYGPRQVLVQTTPKDSLYKLIIDNPFSEQPSTTRLPALEINEQNTEAIQNRSVAMQVQNTFWADQSLRYQYPTVDSTAFYGIAEESYLLDAYTRFPTMEDILREYVLGVLPRKRQGHFRLMVPNAPYREFFDEEPMVLVDGVPVYDMDKVMAFSPLKIQKLDVITNRYFMGTALFNGLISFMTYKGDLAGFPLDTRVLKLDYDGLQLQREFYAPRYTNANQQESRLPDARTLLYWNPSVRTNEQGKTQLDFYTSDMAGIYLIDVNGLSKDGNAGFQRILFDVRKPE